MTRASVREQRPVCRSHSLQGLLESGLLFCDTPPPPGQLWDFFSYRVVCTSVAKKFLAGRRLV